MTAATYRNPWHKPMRPEYGPAMFATTAKPTEYRGYLIYQRLPSVFDVVRGGVCKMQCAGKNGAIRRIDSKRGKAAA